MPLLRKFIFLLCCCCAINTLAVPHHIKIKLYGLSNQKVLLAHYFADNTKHADDTALLNANGEGFFKNNKNLTPGIYLLILPDFSNIEFLLDKNQEFEINANFGTKITNLKFNNSPENSDFQQYQTLNNQYKEALKKGSQQSGDALSVFTLKDQLIALEKTLKAKYNSAFLGQLLSSGFLYINREWHPTDVLAFKNFGLFYTPYFKEKLLYYVDSVMPSNIDSTKIMLTQICNNAFVNPVLYQHTTNWLLEHYRHQPNATELFIYIADNYYIPFSTWDSADYLYELQVELEARRHK